MTRKSPIYLHRAAVVARFAACTCALLVTHATAQTIYYDVWRSAVDDPASASQVTAWLQQDYWDDQSAPADQEQFYWVRATEAQESESEWLPSEPPPALKEYEAAVLLRCPTLAKRNDPVPPAAFQLELWIACYNGGGDAVGFEITVYEDDGLSGKTTIATWTPTVYLQDIVNPHKYADTSRLIDGWAYEPSGAHPGCEVFAEIKYAGDTRSKVTGTITIGELDPVPPGPSADILVDGHLCSNHVTWPLAASDTGFGLSDSITRPSLIGETDTTYDGLDVDVDGCSMTINGLHSFNSFDVINSGTVSHSAANTNGMQLTITEHAQVDASSRIDVDVLGHGPNEGLGAGGIGAGTYGGGGGYGGRGGDDVAGVTGGAAYGSATAPTSLGSGGGDPGGNGTGGRAGGAVRLTVGGTLTVDGEITADGTGGAYQAGDVDGGSSGGSIYLTAGTFTGTGSITANGGDGFSGASGGGAGGRIAIHYNTNTFTGTISAAGGSGSENGQNGTIFPSGCDLNTDGEIDLADYALFAGCLVGPDAGVDPGCESRDLDHDNDVDFTDFAIFQLAFGQ